MTLKEKTYFLKLKDAISLEFSKNCGITEPIENWKGDIIVLFQEDLFAKTKGKVSEKWFYTYIKKDIEKLPRIDILNLLSQYVGYKNWNDFSNHNIILKRNRLSRKSNITIGALVFIPLIFICYALYPKIYNYEFIFIDEDTNSPITQYHINIKVIQENESPLHFSSDSLGKFNHQTKADKITLILSSPFYKTDTITRYASSVNNGIIKLKTDDYALMLDYYTNGNIKDWQQRKKDLERIFAPNAKIYQVFKNHKGIEVYTKEDFINKLLIPTSSLKSIKILKKEYTHEQITTLKFIVQ